MVRVLRCEGFSHIADGEKGWHHMNGAESLVRTLVGGEVSVCFTNLGTSEIHCVAALDKVDRMRCVLARSEQVRTP
jgi:hypothetical protein